MDKLGEVDFCILKSKPGYSSCLAGAFFGRVFPFLCTAVFARILFDLTLVPKNKYIMNKKYIPTI